jgi:hypothetical protein
MHEALPSPPRSAQALAWFSILFGAVSLGTVGWGLTNGQPSVVEVVALLAYGAIGLIAGRFALKEIRWAYWAILFVFAIQLVEWGTPKFFFSFIGPISLKFGWGWESPPERFNVNVVAVVACALSFRHALRLTPLHDGPDEESSTQTRGQDA